MYVEYKPSSGTNMPVGPKHISTLKQLYEIPQQGQRRNSQPESISFYAKVPDVYIRPVPSCAQSHISFDPVVESYRKKREEPATFYKEEMRIPYRRNLQNFYQRGQERQLAVDAIPEDTKQKQFAHQYQKSLDEERKQKLEFPQQRNTDTFTSHKDAYMPFDSVYGALGHPHYNHRQNNADKSGNRFLD